MVLAQSSHLDGDVGHGMEFAQGQDDSREGFGTEAQIVDLVFEVVEVVVALLDIHVALNVSHFDSWGHLACRKLCQVTCLR